MALVIKVPGSGSNFAGPALPPIDPVMPTAGALWLIDPTHSSQQWAAGVPSGGSKVRNLAATQARAMIGGTASLDAEVINTGMSGSAGKLERSGKGGMAGILSTSNTTSGAGFALNAPLSIVGYMQANASHSFYFSMWHRVTRRETSAGTNYPIGAFVTTGAAYAMGVLTNGFQTPYNLGYGTYTTDVNTTSPYTSLGPYLRIVSGTPLPAAFGSADPSTVDRYMWQIGNYGMGNRTGSQAGKTGSRVFYRSYCEDLTVSGRSFATVAAADKAEYQAAVLATTGRYYGDTFTDPATLV